NDSHLGLNAYVFSGAKARARRVAERVRAGSVVVNDVLGNYAGQCNVRLWWPLFIRKFPFQELLDPRRVKVPVNGLKMLDEFMIGGVLHTLLTAKQEKFQSGKLPSDKELLGLCEKGVQAGVQALLEHMKEAEQTNGHVASVLKSALEKSR
ncbi:MAG: aldehyde dehydrogenase family protein, partial [Gammaproteobacteria bacterium]